MNSRTWKGMKDGLEKKMRKKEWEKYAKRVSDCHGAGGNLTCIEN